MEGHYKPICLWKEIYATRYWWIQIGTTLSIATFFFSPSSTPSVVMRLALNLWKQINVTQYRCIQIEITFWFPTIFIFYSPSSLPSVVMRLALILSESPCAIYQTRSVIKFPFVTINYILMVPDWPLHT